MLGTVVLNTREPINEMLFNYSSRTVGSRYRNIHIAALLLDLPGVGDVGDQAFEIAKDHLTFAAFGKELKDALLLFTELQH